MLADPRIGYSIVLPEGWKEVDAKAVTRDAPDPAGVPSAAAAQMRENARMAWLELPDGAGLKTLTVAYADYEAMGLGGPPETDAQRAALAEAVLEGARDALRTLGMTPVPAAQPAGGVAVAASWSLPDGLTVYSLRHLRFTRAHVLSAAVGCVGPASLDCAEEAAALLDALRIGPGERTAPRPESRPEPHGPRHAAPSLLPAPSGALP